MEYLVALGYTLAVFFLGFMSGRKKLKPVEVLAMLLIALGISALTVFVLKELIVCI